MSETVRLHAPWWLPGGHLETIVPALWPAPAPGGREERRVVRVAPDASLLLQVSRPASRPRGSLILIHGMASSAEAHYLRTMGREALARGWLLVRLNARNCGGSEHLCRTLANAAQSEDVGEVLGGLERDAFPRPFAVVGYSLGGSLLLRHAALAGRDCLADRLVGVNPALDLEACSRALERPANALFQAFFTWQLCQGLGRIRRVRPVSGPRPWPWLVRTVRRFDSLYTAPDGGYPSAESYYQQASAGPLLGGVRVRGLLLSSANDPFVPLESFEPWLETPPDSLRFVITRRGGHCGYWQGGSPRVWADRFLLDWLEGSA